MLRNNIEYQDYLPRLFPELCNADASECIVKTFTFQVTDGCSLRCSYCYQINKRNNYMTFETAKTMIDHLFENRLNPDFLFCQDKTKGLIIEFIGGEPFLAMKLIHQICDYFEAKVLEYPDCPWLIHHKYNFSSNGVAYFDDDVQSFLQKYQSISSINITIDGCKELHDQCRLFPDGSGSYDLAIKAALDQLRQGYAGTKITISPENVGYVFEGIKNMLSLKFKYININCVFEEGWDNSHAKILYSQLRQAADWILDNDLQDSCYIAFFDTEKYKSKKLEKGFDRNWCGVVGNMLAMDYKGDIYPCIRFMESSLGDEVAPYKIGHIDTGIASNKVEQERISTLNSLTKSVQSTEECLNCPIESGCSWCSGYNYQKFGTLEKRATFICQMHKAGALGALYFYTKAKDKDSYREIKITKAQALEIIDEAEWNFLKGGID